MIKSVPLTAAQKLVVEKWSNSLKKTDQKDGTQMYLGLNVKLLLFFKDALLVFLIDLITLYYN